MAFTNKCNLPVPDLPESTLLLRVSGLIEFECRHRQAPPPPPQGTHKQCKRRCQSAWTPWNSITPPIIRSRSMWCTTIIGTRYLLCVWRLQLANLGPSLAHTTQIGPLQALNVVQPGAMQFEAISGPAVTAPPHHAPLRGHWHHHGRAGMTTANHYYSPTPHSLCMRAGGRRPDN